MTAPAVPRKTQARLALISQLGRVRSGNGYWTELGLNVSSDRKPVQEHRAGEMPRAAITWMSARPDSKGCIGPVGTVICPFVIYIVVGGPRGEIQNLIDRTEQDVLRGVFADRSLGGVVDNTEWIGSETDQQLLVSLDEGQQVRAQLALTFEATYKATASTL